MKKFGIVMVLLGLLFSVVTYAATYQGDQTFLDNVTVKTNMIVTGNASVGKTLTVNAITSTTTGDIGWAIVAGADTACTTTCTNACVFGWDSATTGDTAVECDDATADKCLCAGAN